MLFIREERKRKPQKAQRIRMVFLPQRRIEMFFYRKERKRKPQKAQRNRMVFLPQKAQRIRMLFLYCK